MLQKLLSTFFLFFCFISSAQVVINEIDADNPGSDIFEFVAIKSGTTFIKRSHYQTFSNERIDLAVTIKIN